MAGIRFSELAGKFVSSLELAGATVLESSGRSSRPLSLDVVMGSSTLRLEVYLWTITQGGKGRRRPREYRIQRTAARPFILKAGIRTIMGGWHAETETFAFWDVRRHLTKAKSPSSQISLDTLEYAAHTGMATERRKVTDGEEIAIAIHPDYLLWYVQEYGRIYDVARETENAGLLVGARQEEDRVFIDSGISSASASRRHNLIEVIRNFRDARFRPLVLRAYNYRCCLTGIALRLVDAAHIVPVSDPTSTDAPDNGIALNPLLHRAYDTGLLGLLPGGRTAINGRLMSSLQDRHFDSGIEILRGMIPKEMSMPRLPELIPQDAYFLKGLRVRGWSQEEIAKAS